MFKVIFKAFIGILLLTQFSSELFAKKTCNQILSKSSTPLARADWLDRAESEVSALVLSAKDLRLPNNTREQLSALTRIEKLFVEAAAKSDPIKSRALRRVAAQIAKLRDDLETGFALPHDSDSANFMIALVETQSLLQRALDDDFQADSLPYLFTEHFENGRRSTVHALKIRLRHEAHDRVLVRVTFKKEGDHYRLGVKEVRWENRHHAYQN